MHSIPLPLGQYGYTKLVAGSTYSGHFYCIQCLGRTTFTTMVDAANPETSFAAISLADGTLLWGHFTDMIVSTGTALAYKVKR